jgi:hypothetical protein
VARLGYYFLATDISFPPKIISCGVCYYFIPTFLCHDWLLIAGWAAVLMATST